MTEETILDVVRMALMTVITTAAPPLIIGLSIGILVSVFQAVTSIQEATLAFVPKILGVLLAILIFGPFMMNNIQELFYELYNNIPIFIKPR